MIFQGNLSDLAPCRVIQISESAKFLRVESEILSFGICNWAQEVRNPAKDWNPESKFHWKRIWNPLPRIQNPQRGIQSPRLFWIILNDATLKTSVLEEGGHVNWREGAMIGKITVVSLRGLQKRSLTPWLIDWLINLSSGWRKTSQRRPIFF